MALQLTKQDTQGGVEITDHNLSRGWIARTFARNNLLSVSIIHYDRGERIDLSPEQVETLRKILNKGYRA